MWNEWWHVSRYNLCLFPLLLKTGFNRISIRLSQLSTKVFECYIINFIVDRNHNSDLILYANIEILKSVRIKKKSTHTHTHFHNVDTCFIVYWRRIDSSYVLKGQRIQSNKFKVTIKLREKMELYHFDD